VQRELFAPPGLPFKSIVMRELDGNDDVDIGVWVDQQLALQNVDMKSNAAAVKIMEIQRRESIRRSIVSIDGAEVNKHSAPFGAMDRWSRRTMQFVGSAFQALNGVEEEELKKFLAGEPPTTTPKSISHPVSTDGQSAA
jgi:predicted Holliday junction resolvase-like endonuclease